MCCVLIGVLMILCISCFCGRLSLNKFSRFDVGAWKLISVSSTGATESQLSWFEGTTVEVNTLFLTLYKVRKFWKCEHFSALKSHQELQFVMFLWWNPRYLDDFFCCVLWPYHFCHWFLISMLCPCKVFKWPFAHTGHLASWAWSSETEEMEDCSPKYKPISPIVCISLCLLMTFLC